MTIEQRLSDAILDLQGMLASGILIEEALFTASADYNLRIDVLRFRASKMLGPLDRVKDRVSNESDRARAINVSKSAIYEYAGIEANEPATDWLRSKLGREPTQAEVQEAYNLSLRNWLTRHWDDPVDHNDRN